MQFATNLMIYWEKNRVRCMVRGSFSNLGLGNLG